MVLFVVKRLLTKRRVNCGIQNVIKFGLWKINWLVLLCLIKIGSNGSKIYTLYLSILFNTPRFVQEFLIKGMAYDLSRLFTSSIIGVHQLLLLGLFAEDVLKFFHTFLIVICLCSLENMLLFFTCQVERDRCLLFPR